jgi:predicted phosphodiesterase
MMAILADIHSNLPALEAVLADADAHGCARIISLGDVVGYLAEPEACIDLLRARGALNIMGNHDSYIVDGVVCPRSRAVTRIINFQRTILSGEHVSWLSQSPVITQEYDTLFLHGGPIDPTDQYLYSVSRSTLPEGVKQLFSGHTHVQALLRFNDGTTFCNPGSVGQPRDGDPRAAYALYDGDNITLRRIPYDIDRTAAAMKKAGFEPFFYENLYAGTQIGGRIDRIKKQTDEGIHGPG